MQFLNLLQDLIDVRNMGAGKSKIDELRRSIDVGVPLKCCNLSRGNKQQIVKVGLQLTHGVVVRDCIVIADCDEVEVSSCCAFHRPVKRARDFLP